MKETATTAQSDLNAPQVRTCQEGRRGLQAVQAAAFRCSQPEQRRTLYLTIIRAAVPLTSSRGSLSQTSLQPDTDGFGLISSS